MGRYNKFRKRSMVERAAAIVRGFFTLLGIAVFLYYAYYGCASDAIRIYVFDFFLTLIKNVINGT